MHVRAHTHTHKALYNKWHILLHLTIVWLVGWITGLNCLLSSLSSSSRTHMVEGENGVL